MLYTIINNIIDLASDRKGNAMARSNYKFQKYQKEIDKKKKKEEKKQSKLDKKMVETDQVEGDETEQDLTPSMDDLQE